MRTLMRRWLPLPWLLRARRLWYWPAEVRDRLRGRDPALPPRWLRFVGGGDFGAVGERFVRHFRALAGLRPDEAVLEVGCGCGRIARALTEYLGPAGRYEGFDVVADAVRWCRRALTPAFPNFHFRHADVRNGGYNPRGGRSATNFVFPYADASFDFVFLTSVCTHMLPDEMARYLAETRRVLRPGGRCLATFFILNAEARALMGGPQSTFVFRHQRPGYWTIRPDHPEDAVGYAEDDLRTAFGRAGLRVREPIWYGSWCGRADTLDGQDVMLADRDRE